jgi:hypothetical protein
MNFIDFMFLVGATLVVALGLWSLVVALGRDKPAPYRMFNIFLRRQFHSGAINFRR